MNASMNDTHNLGASIFFFSDTLTYIVVAWKLTHVLRGWADMSLLSTASFSLVINKTKHMLKSPPILVRIGEEKICPGPH